MHSRQALAVSHLTGDEGDHAITWQGGSVLSGVSLAPRAITGFMGLSVNWQEVGLGYSFRAFVRLSLAVRANPSGSVRVLSMQLLVIS